MTRSATLISNSTGSGTSVTKNLPGAVSSLGSPLRSSPRKLWSQGYTISPVRGHVLNPQSPSQTMLGVGNPLSHSANLQQSRFLSGGSPVVADRGDLLLEEQRWRNALSGNSPSRLRDTFDSI